MDILHFVSAAPDRLSIAMRCWEPPTAARGAVLIAHGAAEHGGRYARLAADLNAAGLAVAAVDHRGHGLTGQCGQLGVFADEDGWNRAVLDLDQAADLSRARWPGRPLALLGHSLGSLLVQQYLAEHGARIDAAVLSGSMLVDGFQQLIPLVEAETARNGRAAPCGAMADLMAGGGFNAGIAAPQTPFDWLSRDPAEVQAYIDDPLCGFPLSNGAWLDLLKHHRIPQLAAEYARIPRDLPILVMAGECDPVSQNLTALHELLRRYAAAGLTRVSSRFYAGARHEIFNETNRAEVSADLVQWLSRNLRDRAGA